MPTVTFLGERGQPNVSQLDIVGILLPRNQAVTVIAQQCAALRAHPQFKQFWFEITEDPPERVIGAEPASEPEPNSKDPFPALPEVGAEVAEDLHQRVFVTLDDLRQAGDKALTAPRVGKRALRANRKRINQEETHGAND